MRLDSVDARAEARGLAPGMPLPDARGLASDLQTFPAAPKAEAALLRRLARWCERYTPWTAPEGRDGLFLEITGCAHLFGGEAALLGDLTRRLRGFGFTVEAGLADSPGAAWAAARFGSGTEIVAPGGSRSFLDALPVQALRLTPEAAEGLERLGLRRVGQLHALPRATLAARFGRELLCRLDQALGHEAESISPQRPTNALRERLEPTEPLITPEALGTALERLLERLCRRLESGGSGARRLDLLLFRVDGERRRLTIGTSRPLRDPRRLRRLFAEPLETVDPGFGIETLVLEAPRTDPLTAAQQGLERATARRRSDELAPLLDRLGNRLGFSRLYRQAPADRFLPERAVRRQPPAETPTATAEAPPLAGRPPLRLLRRPWPIEAETGPPLTPPEAFVWRGRRYPLSAGDGPERILPPWWHSPNTPGARDYWRVEDEAGRRFWIYRQDGAWYLQGFFP